MVQVDIRHIGAVQFEAKARHHVLVCDQPPELFGSDEGMASSELLLASLGSCVGFYALLYLKKTDLDSAGLRIRLNAEKVGYPVRLDDFSVEIEVSTELSDEQKSGLQKAVQNCLVHQTIATPPKVAFQIKSRKAPRMTAVG